MTGSDEPLRSVWITWQASNPTGGCDQRSGVHEMMTHILAIEFSKHIWGYHIQNPNNLICTRWMPIIFLEYHLLTIFFTLVTPLLICYMMMVFFVNLLSCMKGADLTFTLCLKLPLRDEKHGVWTDVRTFFCNHSRKAPRICLVWHPSNQWFK